MCEYVFTLKFRLPDADAAPEQFIDALAAPGCEDATVGVGQQGRVALVFIREAANAADAILSAVRDLRAAIPGAEVVEAAPDFVGLTDVAELVGCSRQNIRKLMVSNSATLLSQFTNARRPSGICIRSCSGSRKPRNAPSTRTDRHIRSDHEPERRQVSAPPSRRSASRAAPGAVYVNTQPCQAKLELTDELFCLARGNDETRPPDGMSEEEFAFYQALAENESAAHELGQPPRAARRQGKVSAAQAARGDREGDRAGGIAGGCVGRVVV